MHVVSLRAENRRLLREMAKLEARIEHARDDPLANR